MYTPGTSEELLRKLFVVAEMEKPSVIFIDDLDCLTIKKNHAQRVRSALIWQMENVNDGVFVIATTNKPQKLINDHKVLRHFDYLINISLPSKGDRLKMLKNQFIEEKCENFKEEYFEELATKTRGYDSL